MKVVSSLKTIKERERNCRVIRRRGRLYVINKRIHVLKRVRDNLSFHYFY